MERENLSGIAMYIPSVPREERDAATSDVVARPPKTLAHFHELSLGPQSAGGACSASRVELLVLDDMYSGRKFVY